MKVTLEKSTERGFSRGERAIMVDGVRWGRTVVTHHGVHGTKHVFWQEGGDPIYEDKREKRPREIVVRSMRRRRFSDAGEWQTTESLVLEKAIELVKAGKLRDPDVVRAETAAANERYREQAAAQEAERKAAFEARARDVLIALAVIGLTNQPNPEDIAAVVAAMEWAQTQ